MKEKLKQFTIRLNEKDHKNLIEQAKYLGISQAELLRELLRKNMISDIKDYNIFLDELRRDVRTLTNNVNQIAKKVNSDILINELEEANNLHKEITKNMAIIKVVKSSGKSKGSIKAVADYVGKKAYDTFGINCSQDYKEIPKHFDETKEYFGKNGGRLYKHYIQSFAPNEVKKEDVIEIAKEWAERVFKGYEVFIATHDDKNHLHAHFLVNSVSFENGRKLHESKNDLKEKKKINDEICLEYGIENKFKPKPKGEITTFDNQKYQIIKKGADITTLAEKVLENMKISKSKEDFINNMKKSGYQVEWRDNKKNVVFILDSKILKGKKNKFRLSNLQKTFNISDFTKERLLEIFKENKDKELDEISRKIDFGIEKERKDNKDLKSISEDTNFNKKDLDILFSKEFDFKINEKENSFERYINSKKEELER